MLNMTPNDVPATGSSSAPKIEDGVYPGLISMIVDLGVQKNKKFDSKDKPDEACTDADYDVGHMLWYSFCLPTERYEAEYEGETVERDQVIGKQYKVSKSDKSNLVKMYKAVVKDGRNFGEMLSMPVTITSGTTSGGKPRVDGVAGPMRGSSVGAPLREPILVTDADWEAIDNEADNAPDIPDFLKDMIKNRVQ